MTVDRAWLNELPPIPDEQGWRTPDSAAFFADARERGDNARARSLYWSLRIGEETEQWADLAAMLPGYQWTQVGFLTDTEDNPPRFDRAGRFGLLICCDDPQTPPRLLDRRVEVDGASFPIAVVSAWFEPHVRITSPQTACVTGWARSRRSTAPRSGWLTAGHAAPSSHVINFSDGGTGQVVDRAPPCVDAAIVSTNRPPFGCRPAAIAVSVVTGDAVRLHDQNGALAPATVRTVDPTLGVTVSSYFPVRFSMDRHGQPGDSGALVDQQATGELAGIYLGCYVDHHGGGAAFGVALSAHYLATLLDMEISL